MYKNIMLPTDGSTLSRRTVKDAMRVAAKLGARVTGFYVAPAYHIEFYTDYIVPPDVITPKQHEESARKAAQHHLEFIKKTASAHGVRHACYYVINDFPAEAIVKAARKYKCDLIYMGSHGRSGLSKIFLGSQTSKVLAQSKIPVLVHR